MASSSLTLSPHSFSLSPQTHLCRFNLHTNTILRFHPFQSLRVLQASRRTPNFRKDRSNLVDDRLNWSRNRGRVVTGDYDEYGNEDDEDEDDGEEDRSLDLLVKFMENVFKKISRRARKAVRSVLPLSISTKLVGFSVNGVIVLTFLWVLKAFLELLEEVYDSFAQKKHLFLRHTLIVVCTLGSVVFVSILLIRGIWSGVSYLQESRIHNHKVNRLDDDHAWTGARPAT